MIIWLSAHVSTIIVGLVVCLIVGLIVRSMYKNKKAGKGSCSCADGCGSCGSATLCHPEMPEK